MGGVGGLGVGPGGVGLGSVRGLGVGLGVGTLQGFAVARIGARVDLDAIQEGDLLVDEGRVVLRLPAAMLTYVSVDNEATHVYNRDTGGAGDDKSGGLK